MERITQFLHAAGISGAETGTDQRWDWFRAGVRARLEIREADSRMAWYVLDADGSSVVDSSTVVDLATGDVASNSDAMRASFDQFCEIVRNLDLVVE